MARDKARQQESQKRHRDKLFYHLMEYLKDKECVDCGISDPVILQFDHLPEFEKKFNVGRAITGSTRSWEAILVEIAKCELVCANCHAKRTAERSGWRKFLMGKGQFEHAPDLFEKRRSFRVGHGEGVRGRRGCTCEPCRAKNAQYSKFHRDKKLGLL